MLNTGPGFSVTRRASTQPYSRVPLVLHFPARLPANVRRTETVSIRDIPATILDVLGIADTVGMPGTSLVRYARGVATPEETTEPRLATTEVDRFASFCPTCPASQGEMFTLFRENWHYILDGTGAEQLYASIWSRGSATTSQPRPKPPSFSSGSGRSSTPWFLRRTESGGPLPVSVRRADSACASPDRRLPSRSRFRGASRAAKGVENRTGISLCTDRTRWRLPSRR